MAQRVLSAMMKAVRINKFGGSEVLTVKSDVPIPKPGKNEIVMKVSSAGVNPVDTYIRNGAYAALPQLPYTPGKDAAGVIHDVGEGVSKFKKGDRVYTFSSTSGSCAEYALIDAAKTFPLHGNLSFEQGAALGVAYFTAYRALVQKARASPGQTVLVHGASGGVGLAAVQIARALGLTVLGTASSAAGQRAVNDSGAHQTFNHRQPDYLDKIKTYAKGVGVDIILEMLADVNLVKDFNVVRADGNGTIVIIGCRGSLDFSPRLAIGSEATIKGVALMKGTLEEHAEAAAFLQSGQELGWLRPVIGLRYAPEQISEAHDEVIARKTGAPGKVVLNFSGS